MSKQVPMLGQDRLSSIRLHHRDHMHMTWVWIIAVHKKSRQYANDVAKKNTVHP